MPEEPERRRLLRALALGTLGVCAGSAAEAGKVGTSVTSNEVELAHNENPYGPGPAALDAVRLVARSGHRYGRGLAATLIHTIAELHGVPEEFVLLSGGSGDVMRAAVYEFSGRSRALVTARPTYEVPMRSAQHIGAPVIRVPLASTLRVDTAAIAERALGAGLVYICNPNNPTGSLVPQSGMTRLVEQLTSSSPTTRLMVDEAYLDYVDVPCAMSLAPLTLLHPQLIVTRTFSKIHGMAGMRVGYAIAHPDTLAGIRRRHSQSSLSSVSLAAATAALGDAAHLARMVDLNRAVRQSMIDTFTARGYNCAPADANFVFVNIGIDAAAFADACARRRVIIGRPFPPMTQWARIAVGAADEMRVAMPVFLEVLEHTRRQRTS